MCCSERLLRRHDEADSDPLAIKIYARVALGASARM